MVDSLATAGSTALVLGLVCLALWRALRESQRETLAEARARLDSAHKYIAWLQGLLVEEKEEGQE